MTSPIVFSNPGELDSRVITLMGVNVKPGSDNPIGQFGTGLKYAIAGILRLGGKIEIWSGLHQFEFRTKTETIRGKEFQVVQMYTSPSDEPGHGWQTLGFTLELGRHWEPWMLYRELWANARDERGRVEEREVAPAAGMTIIRVDCQEIWKAHQNRGEFLLDSTRQPIWTGYGLEVYPAAGKAGFYRGIKVVDFQEPMLFTYNITSPMTLTEDRTIGDWSFKARLADCLWICDSEEVAENIALANKTTMEAGINWDWVMASPSEAMLVSVQRAWAERPATMNQRLLEKARRYLPDTGPQEVKLTALETKMLSRALEFLARHRFEIKARILVVETLGSQEILGMARKSREEIWLPRSLFGKGTKMLVSTLLEEYVHIKLGLNDETRSLQDWLLDKVVSLMEELDGQPI